MKFIADLHIHSHYSRATSKQLNLEQLYKWAQIKGIKVVGTGDISHPGWLEEIRTKLEPAETGLFKLKNEYVKIVQEEVPDACQSEVRFILSGEISNIYKKNDRVRKNHNVVFFPSIKVAQQFQVSLEKIGNIRSDGRPILGLDARNLLEMVIESDDLSFLIPAHIWTPWFSVLGSKSGFDSIDECFDDLTPHIFALETGLSSDPPMNWRLSILDRYTLVSNSDAHSPAKLAREGNIFNCDLSYPAMLEAMKTGNPDQFLGTIEFFPEEGKYHLDGHRKCEQRLSPAETKSNNGLCPVCGKPVTVGVLYRVEELADRPERSKHENCKPFYSLIPLPEVLSELLNVGPNTKKVNLQYEMLLNKLGAELDILFEIPLSEIEKTGGSLLAEGIRRMRESEVQPQGGYDGEFGVIKLFNEKEKLEFSNQTAIFQDEFTPPTEEQTSVKQLSLVRDESEKDEYIKKEPPAAPVKFIEDYEDESGLNVRQKEAIDYEGKSLLIVAGPGTGKTRTITYRMAHLIQEKNIAPENFLAVTFTNRAAEEMSNRLFGLLEEDQVEKITIKTFHALGNLILKNEAGLIGFQSNFSIFSEDDKIQLLKQIFPKLSVREARDLGKKISEAKNSLYDLKAEDKLIKQDIKDKFYQQYQKYQQTLKQQQAFDFDDLLVQPIIIFNKHPKIRRKYQSQFKYISVDEYQDINFAQYMLLRQLTGAKTNLCAIGDPDQAIYGFRGSERRFFLQFEEDFPGTKIFRLEKNYRSESTILKASTQVIEKNEDHQPANIWSNLISDTRVDIFQTPTEKSEAETIVHQIEKLVGATSFFSVDSGRAGEEDAASGFSDIAVLYRVHAQLGPLEEAFLRSGIPYQTFGETPFYQIPEVKELISLLKIFRNPNSDADLIKIIMLPPKRLNDQTFNMLAKYRTDNDYSFWRAMERCDQIALLSETQKQPIHQLVKQIKNITEKFSDSSVDTILIKSMETLRLNSYFKADKKKQFYLDELLKIMKDFQGSLSDFLEQIILRQETDVYQPKAEKVALMSLHAAKGLEFSTVFITGCEEDLIPYRKKDEPVDLGEERRLFYVGMTRAKKRLILLFARSRFLFGERRSNRPSRFLNDIEQALKENRQAQIRNKQKEKSQDGDDSQLKLF